MQTFLPYADFEASARALDRQRLGKQRSETLQVLRAITVPGYGWRHHPVVAMWRGHEEALGAYGVAICREWCWRGYSDTCEAKIRVELGELGISTVRTQKQLARARRLPLWLGDDNLHRAYRSALVAKDPDYYGELFPGVPPDIPYVWPVPARALQGRPAVETKPPRASAGGVDSGARLEEPE